MKNIDTGIKRIGLVIVLDPPDNWEGSADNEQIYSHSSKEMLIFHSCVFPPNGKRLLELDIAYISPTLAFNLDLHESCLKSLVRGGEEILTSYFKDKLNDEMCAKSAEGHGIDIELEPLCMFPRYASHLRISFVKIPECGMLESLKGSSPLEAEHRQELIDLSLQNYFKVDRYLARDDIFSVHINWNCKSSICIPCNQSSQHKTDGTIYFKVSSLEFFYCYS